MAQTKTSRRERVERGIYKRTVKDAEGKPVDRFEIGWRDSQGKQRWRRVEGGITAARARLAEEHGDRARGKQIAANPRLRFEQAVEEWLKSPGASSRRPATKATHKSALVHLHKWFGRQRLTEISTDDVARFVEAQRAAGYKGWTIKGHLSTLSAVFSYAGRRLGFQGANPVSRLEAAEQPSLEDERPKRVLAPDELDRLIAAVEPQYRLLFELAAETGARLGETLGLVWGEVDLDAQTVTFTHQLSKGERVALKTTRSRRCLEVTPELVAKLRTAKLASADSSAHGFVFVGRTGTPHDHRNIGGRVLARAVKRAGLEAVERDGQVVEHAPTFHNLRHSHGSALIAAGWDIEEVSARLGHANIATTSRIYVHAYDAARRSAERRDRLTVLYSRDAVTAAGEVVELREHGGK
ncbi:MAG: site-specific integrase [Solirubrobacteraceae bacterium]